MDRAARKYASFNEFLTAQKAGETGTWQKPASDVVENSSSDTNEKVGETVESTPSPSAEPASVDTANQERTLADAIADFNAAEASKTPEQKKEDARKLAMLNANYIANGSKSEQLSHPTAPNVTAEGDPNAPATPESVRSVETTVSIQRVDWMDGEVLTYVHEEAKLRDENPDWWRDVYLGGRELGIALGDPEKIAAQIREYYVRQEKLTRAIQGLRGVLEEKLHGTTTETRARIINKTSIAHKTHLEKAAQKDAKADMKADKPVKIKTGIGIKLATSYAEMFKMKPGPKTVAKLLAQCKENNVLDDATIAHINTTWGAK